LLASSLAFSLAFVSSSSFCNRTATCRNELFNRQYISQGLEGRLRVLNTSGMIVATKVIIIQNKNSLNVMIIQNKNALH
jgi:hypothetical protein